MSVGIRQRSRSIAKLSAANHITYVRHPQRAIATIAGGLVVLGICMLIAADGDVGDIERPVFDAVNGLPDTLQAPMWIFQLVGLIGVAAVAAAATFALGYRRLGGALALAIPLKLAMEWWVVKAIVERERPEFTVPGANIRSDASALLGFPSGHAVFAFALAGLLAPYLGRRWKIVVYLLAVMNSVARVYLGAHNPLDVVAGAGLGVAIAAVLNLAVGAPIRHVGSTGS